MIGDINVAQWVQWFVMIALAAGAFLLVLVYGASVLSGQTEDREQEALESLRGLSVGGEKQ